MLVGILGINHKLADLKLRETLARTCQRKFGADQSIHGDHVFVLLSTCNRTEIYFSSEDLAATHTYIMSILRNEAGDGFDQKLYSYFGYDCFLHLARVTAGLDSAIIAETEIQGQVKNAYESALQTRTIPKELHFLFQKVLKIGKKIRFNLPLQRGFPNLECAVFKAGQHHFKEAHPIKILFIGASEINCKILHYFKSKNIQNISICNRTLKKAEELKEIYDVSVLPWESIESWHEYDWIICGTKSPDYLIKNQLLFKSKFQHKLIMDLSVPRNVNPSIGMNSDITLMNIDEINDVMHHRTKNMEHTLVKTEEMIVQETRRHVLTFKEKERYSQNFVNGINRLNITA